MLSAVAKLKLKSGGSMNDEIRFGGGKQDHRSAYDNLGKSFLKPCKGLGLLH